MHNKQYTYEDMRAWEEIHGESYLDYHGDSQLPNVQLLADRLSVVYPEVNWEEGKDEYWGVMDFYGLMEEENDVDHVLLAFSEVI